MTRTLLLALVIIPVMGWSQDFTRISSDEVEDSVGVAYSTLLVLPYHPHYHISEVDRIMAGDMDVMTMREKLRSSINRRVCTALGDSIETLDLSIQSHDDIDLVDYMYNAIDYGYAKAEKIEEKPKGKIRLRLPKKKEEKVYGAYSVQSEGQLDRREVMHDRYMSATVTNKGAVEYLQDLHSFQYLLVITQLEVTRNLDDIDPAPYAASIHYELLDDNGDWHVGNKETIYLEREELSYDVFSDSVASTMAQGILKTIWTKINSVEGKSLDYPDY